MLKLMYQQGIVERSCIFYMHGEDHALPFFHLTENIFIILLKKKNTFLQCDKIIQLQRYIHKALTITFYNKCIITFYNVHSLVPHLFISITTERSILKLLFLYLL